MTDEQMRVKIAEACGMKCGLCNGTGIRAKFGKQEYTIMRESNPVWLKMWPKTEPDIACRHEHLPDYPNDLNACHEMEKVLTESQREEYRGRLGDITHPNRSLVFIWHATARQRCEAFLRTIGQWEEDK